MPTPLAAVVGDYPAAAKAVLAVAKQVVSAAVHTADEPLATQVLAAGLATGPAAIVPDRRQAVAEAATGRARLPAAAAVLAVAAIEPDPAQTVTPAPGRLTPVAAALALQHPAGWQLRFVAQPV